MASSPFCDYDWVQGSPLPRKRETREGFHIQSSDLPFGYLPVRTPLVHIHVRNLLAVNHEHHDLGDIGCVFGDFIQVL